jgi:hypothetical protein
MNGRPLSSASHTDPAESSTGNILRRRPLAKPLFCVDLLGFSAMRRGVLLRHGGAARCTPVKHALSNIG